MPKGDKKKQEQEQPVAPENPEEKVPKSFVFAKPGKAGHDVTSLMLDFRRVMLPNTAPNLQVTKRNVLKDFLQVAGPLGVTHLLSFTSTVKGIYLRMARMPRGPTLTFRIDQYSLMKDLANTQLNPAFVKKDFEVAPLVVLNNFTQDVPQVKLTKSMFQHLFPALNIETAKTEDCKRVALLSRNSADDSIEFRHFHIKTRPVGITKPLREVLEKAGEVDLSQYRDASSTSSSP
ncbi:putative Brix domain [Paratrimastix pyriformis]|uniref:Brix domain n=1 Tax=Paratrimastix pyriformis TaxID=342808 RepID=A0ABQ8U9Y7_9EUKA|nr:putative Brix domain [Paratrimastix pyriformis]